MGSLLYLGAAAAYQHSQRKAIKPAKVGNGEVVNNEGQPTYKPVVSVGVSMETPPFIMTSFQSAYGQVVAWCEYLSSETDGRIAS